MDKIETFRSYRAEMNKKLISSDDKVIKRIFSLDALAYKEGKLNTQTKELIGLTCSLVLRCDDCVKYHLEQCVVAGLTKEEIVEGLSLATLVGGTIVVPHLRRAYDYLDALFEEN
ncbi:MAG: carboxymuconolactone decarboxylase family protein [Bacteroidota bacterium]